ncbi:hypothetical protein [Bradyrhizobium australafricanum]|uniref:hypothetical protein n=1 Tax=Bradyrhizobium australafricanum TaxID=2821406 RepID=UPI001CE3145D|nr:hypothetical protein [Bradyrhizobium australafricanum]MCA6105104.1 hypothetical protein [Bradyrhizobium australafricanum]
MSEIDTYGVQEVFVEALARVERIGPNRRLVFVITAPNSNGTRDQVAVVKVAMSAEASFQAAQAMLSDGGEAVLGLIVPSSTAWAN